MLRKWLLCLKVFLFSSFFLGGLTTAYALEFNTPGNPASVTLTGATEGNITSAITRFDLTNFYPNAVVSSAQFSLKQATVLDAGTIKVYDNYTYATSQATALIGEFNPRQENSYSFNILKYVTAWISNPNSNQGILLKASNFEDEASLVLEHFNLKLEFTLPDKVKPILLATPETQRINAKTYRITAKADEPVTAILEFGKTSNYGETLSQPSLATDIQFEILEAQEGVTYHYRLKITDAAGNTTVSNNFTFLVTSNVNPTLQIDDDFQINISNTRVMELNAQLTEVSGSYAVKLTWSKVDESTIEGYKIYRKDNINNTYEELSRINKDVTTYLDLQIILGQELQYKIVTFVDADESKGTESLKVIIPETAPSEMAGEPANVTLFFVLGIATTAFVFYIIIKMGGRFKSLFTAKNKKTQLDNVFRDPELVE